MVVVALVRRKEEVCSAKTAYPVESVMRNQKTLRSLVRLVQP
jgi:hypothetical protein